MAIYLGRYVDTYFGSVQVGNTSTWERGALAPGNVYYHSTQHVRQAGQIDGGAEGQLKGQAGREGPGTL